MVMYRKLPVVVEAKQWTGDNVCELRDWTADNFLGAVFALPAELYVAANGAWLDLDVGEWIIKDALGFYPCKPDIFAATYEAV
jgi:hypothetical protein